MQNNSANKDDKRDDAARRAVDSEINDRLVDVLKANAIKAGVPVEADRHEVPRGFFSEAYAVLGLVALMIVAYVYTVFVGNDA